MCPGFQPQELCSKKPADAAKVSAVLDIEDTAEPQPNLSRALKRRIAGNLIDTGAGIALRMPKMI